MDCCVTGLASSRWNLTRSVCALLLCAVPAAAAGTTFYVSSTGRDNDQGTSPARAWRSLDRVNQQRLRPGDTVLLEGGSTFPGTLRVVAPEGGTPSEPITFGSYGAERATLWANRGRGIDVYNAAGIRIQDLVVSGAGLGQNDQVGITFFADLPGDVKLGWIRIQNVRVTGFLRAGISIGGGNGRTGFEDVRVEYCQLDHNAHNGMLVWASSPTGLPQTIDNYAHRSLYIGHNSFESNWGDPAITSTQTGTGLVVGQTAKVLIEYNEAFDNGRLNNCPNGGPVGIWMWDTFLGLIQRNESHHNTSPTYDGGGFDLDGGCVKCVVQYNYSHDNDGPGFLVTQFQGSRPMRNVTVRYNISERDGGRAGVAGLQLWNNDLFGPPIDAALFHSNTVFVEAKPVGIPRGFRAAGNGEVTRSGFLNNIFYSRGSAWVGEAAMPTCVWLGNLYFAEGGPFVIRQSGVSYSSLNAWRAASGQEMLPGRPTGFQFDPLLTAPGAGGTIGVPGALGSLAAYKLLAQSPAHDLGLFLPSFGISVGNRDFYGGVPLLGAGYDLGAHEGR